MDRRTSKPARRRARRKDTPVEAIRFVLYVFVAAFLLRAFVAAAFSIPSGSMLPKMMIGDYLFVTKWDYGYSRYSIPFGLGAFDGRILNDLPERGDVAVFRYPGGDEDFVKRVIGLPGDRIRMRGGTLYLNGRAVPRTRIADLSVPITPNSPCRYVDPAATRSADGACLYTRYRETLPGGRSYEVLDQIDGVADDTADVVVPAGHVFMMGDNRDDSLDSRFPVSEKGVGFLPIENLIGPAGIVFFSTDGSATWTSPASWFSATRWERIGETY